jgi:acyl-CoA dehydrogenase
VNERQLLLQTADEIMASARHDVEPGALDATLWRTLVELGFHTLGVPEAAGGAGGTFSDAAAVVGIGAGHGAAIPLAETLLAAHLLGAAGMPASAGAATIGIAGSHLECEADGFSVAVSGRLARVPWVRHAEQLVIVSDQAPGPLAIDLECCEVEPGLNLAGEPRDDVSIDVTVSTAGWVEAWTEERAQTTAAAMRVAQIAGALGAIRHLTADYVVQREQFGRAIGSFQVVQHQLAILATVTAAASLAAEYVGEAPHDVVAVGAAKAYVGRIAGDVARIAHELHGAIGFTEEHSLHVFTRRVWAWRDEFGSDSEWAERLGSLALASGSGAWEMVAADAGDRAMV